MGGLLWLIPLAIFAFTRISPRLIDLCMGLGVIQGALVLGQGVVLGTDRAMGFFGNPNPGAGLLAMTSVWAVASGRWWWAIIPIAALPWTGSRLATAAVGVVCLGLFAQHRSWRLPLLAGIFGLSWLLLGPNHYAALTDGLADRLSLSESLRFIPHGYQATAGMHNVLLRLAVEVGLVGAIAWVGATGLALWLRPRFDTTWWLLLTLSLLASLDQYVWWSPFAALWFLLVGIRVSCSRWRCTATQTATTLPRFIC